MLKPFYRSVAAWLPLPRTRIYLGSSKSVAVPAVADYDAGFNSLQAELMGTETQRGLHKKEPQLISARGGHSRKP